MGFLNGKRILITGALTANSIAYGIAQACVREGAKLAFTYKDDRVAKRVQKLAEQVDCDFCFPCDVADDAQIEGVFDRLSSRWNSLDGIVHAIGFAPSEAVSGDYLDGLSRESFHIAHDISSYSFSALAKAARPLMQESGGAMLTLSYIGAVRTMQSYNTMGLAKASLETSVRYLATSLGSKQIRVNGISAAPIRTVAASGLGEFELLLSNHQKAAPLLHQVTIEDIGNASAFLLSNLAAGITGQIVYVDGGFSIN